MWELTENSIVGEVGGGELSDETGDTDTILACHVDVVGVAVVAIEDDGGLPTVLGRGQGNGTPRSLRLWHQVGVAPMEEEIFTFYQTSVGDVETPYALDVLQCVPMGSRAG